ncbi:MAG: beta-ketoacyl synthase N-terminal-like domain-containing protein [Jatrophihabitans sp.]
MSVLIAGSAVRTCYGNGERTFAALLHGRALAVPAVDARSATNDATGQQPVLAARLLAECLAEAVEQAGLDPSRQRVVALVGTGMRELSAVEDRTAAGSTFPARCRQLGDLVHQTLPGLAQVIAISGAGGAGGHVLALAQDLVELGDADVVIACGADVGPPVGGGHPAGSARLSGRAGVGRLHGEGAAAVVLVPESWPAGVLCRLAGTGLSCYAGEEDMADTAGIGASMREAFERTGLDPAAVDLVLADAAAIARADPAECAALRDVVLAAGGDPLVTSGVSSVNGHPSMVASLINVDVALRCLLEGVVPPVAALPSALNLGLRFTVGEPVLRYPSLVQLDTPGFGGVNAVTLLEAG